jgi:hypothetical protein
MALEALSRSNIINGAIDTGSSKDGSGCRSSYEKMLNSCPMIKELCKTNINKMPKLIAK